MDDDLEVAVAERVRQMRLEAGLGVRELARALGISAASLSALENHRAGMSLKRLALVAKYFDLALTDLLAPSASAVLEPAVDVVEVFPAAGAITPSLRRGTGVRHQQLGPGRGHEVQATLLTFEPEGTYESDALGHRGEEFAYVLLGEVELVRGESRYLLRQGDAARFRSDPAHSYRNASSSGMAFVVTAAAPPW